MGDDSVPTNKNGSKRKRVLGSPQPQTYEQAQDPTLRHFLRNGQGYIAQNGMDQQRMGRIPRAEDIRVQAVIQHPLQRYGAGLDEGVPTNMRILVALSRNRALIGAQSGLRGATDLTLLRTRTGLVSGHTGFFRLNANTSTNTIGQASAHDIRRDIFGLGNNYYQTISRVSQNYIQSLATGREIMRSQNITGGVPNFSLYGQIEAHSGPNRIMLAQDSHEARETAKRRLTRLEEDKGLKRSSSNERGRINNDGTGGNYLNPGERGRSHSPFTQIAGIHGTVDHAANITAHISQGLRDHEQRANNRGRGATNNSAQGQRGKPVGPKPPLGGKK